MPRPVLLAVCTACLLFRELDFHKIFTTEEVLKTRFYADPAIGLGEKVPAFLAVAAAVWALLSAAWLCGPPLIAGLRRRSPAATLVSVGVALLFVSKGLDAGVRLWRKNIFDVAPVVQRRVGFVEEISEAFIPALLLAALATVWVSGRHAGRAAVPAEPAVRVEPAPLRRAA